MQSRSITKRIAVSGVIAALYVALTLGLAPISYEAVQFRVSEILNLMAFIDPVYGIGVVLGCFIANLFSPFGLPDIIFGTLATAVAVFAITRTKNLFVASLWPMFANVIVAIELTYILHTPIWYNIITVWIGEFVVVTCVGFPIFRMITRDRRIMELLEPRKDTSK
ncbi:MAG: QueT transporter family protein [Clostridiales bacterium]|nr:QueT transporter family protein [Clostridiales bacterium]